MCQSLTYSEQTTEQANRAILESERASANGMEIVTARHDRHANYTFGSAAPGGPADARSLQEAGGDMTIEWRIDETLSGKTYGCFVIPSNRRGVLEFLRYTQLAILRAYDEEVQSGQRKSPTNPPPISR